jgi:heme-degrading monooxygenase HmoA
VIRATLHIVVKPGREDEFQAAWRRVAEQVRREPGNLRQTLTRDPDDPSSFHVTTDWISREAFTEFEQSHAQEELTAPIRELRVSGEMAVHDLLVHMEGGQTTDAGTRHGDSESQGG